MKKKSVVILAIMMIFCVSGFAMQLESVETSDEIAVNSIGVAELQNVSFEGSGTKDDPFIIADADDFIAFTENMNSGNTYSGKYFEQTDDIDLADRTEYNGCGDGKYFQGYYDGKGHTINVNISGEDRFVFSYVQGKIMNLGFTGSITNTLSTGKPYGAPIRYLLDASGKLINCYSTLTVTSNFYGSGLVGNIKGGTAVNCYFAGIISESVPHKGAITWNLTNDGVITNSYYVTEVLYPHGATQVTNEVLKTSLADTLNEGRKYAAEISGVSENQIFQWTNENGYPEHYVYVETDIITGTGAKSDPYIIDSVSDFITFTRGMNSGNTYQGKYFEQAANIDLVGNAEYTGCDDEKYFQGYYDGKGHTINVNLSGDNKFVFSYVQGRIINLGFTGSVTNTKSSDTKPYGAPIRYLLETGKLANCYSTMTVTSNFYGSGLVGNIKGGTAVNCYFAGIISESVPHKGAITWHLTSEGVISNSYYITDVLYSHGATQVTDETAKTSLADTLNNGREEAAETAGVSVDSIYRWTNQNGYPTMYVLVSENVELDSNSSMVLEYSENITVIDEFGSAVIENNGTKAVKITGKGYNGVLVAKNESDEIVAKITIVGGNMWRPGLNIFTGTKDGYDIETVSLFDNSVSVNVVENPTNNSNKVLKISSGTESFDAQLLLETPIEWDRPYRVDYDVLGKVNGSFSHLMNTTNSNCTLNTFGTSDVSATEWKHITVATNPLWKVNKGTHPYLNKFIIQGTGVEGDDSYALYIDNFSIIPAYKVEYFNAKGESIDVAFYNPMKADTEEVFLATTYKVDYNPNANYIVNGTAVETNGEYTLAYEDLKITVLPNDNAIMFSGMNVAVVVPEGDTYKIPYPHELDGFLADDFVVWTDADGNELEPGTTVNTADYVGKTIYAYCDASAYPRSPANHEVVNMASFRHNSWIANYQPGNIARKADMGTISERGVSFRWEAVDDAVSYTVYYGLDRYLENAKTVTVTATNAKATHLLRDTKYYWYVEATLSDGSKTSTDIWTFTTADVANTYYYLNNMRDLGGMVTEDGLYQIKQNMAIRSGVIDGNTSIIMEKFGFNAELDLRGVEANGRTVSPYGEDVKYILIEGTHYFGNSSSAKHYLNKTGQQRLKEEVQVFADKNNYPLNFHCSAGRDRTGVLAYMIEGLLGIPEDVIMMDYELSWLSGSAASQANSETYFGWMYEFHDYISTFEGETFKDRMESFCLHIGVTEEEIASIREILLEPTDKLQPLSLKVASMRVSGNSGMRIAGFVTDSARSRAEEYGFVVALDKNFANGDYSELKVDSQTVNTVTGVSYSKEMNKDIVYLDAHNNPDAGKSIFGIESADKSGVYFTGVYVNIPETAEAYTTDLVGRTYTKIDGRYYYGEPVVKNLYDISKAVAKTYEERQQPVPEYVKKVIETVESL